MFTLFLRNMGYFAFFFWASFALTTVIYYAVASALGYAFGLWFRMFLYHYEHPLPYIAVACLCYAWGATCFREWLGEQSQGKVRCIWLIGLTPLFASPLGGMIWAYHDMMSGYIPHWYVRKLWEGAFDGVTIGYIITLIGFPYNVICAWAGSKLTYTVARQIVISEKIPQYKDRLLSVFLFIVGYVLIAMLTIGILVALLVHHNRIDKEFKAAFEEGNVYVAQQYIEKNGIDITRRLRAGYEDEGDSALNLAARNPHGQVLRMLLARPIDVYRNEASYFDALGWALTLGHTDNALLLAQYCAGLPATASLKRGFPRLTNQLDFFLSHHHKAASGPVFQIVQIFRDNQTFAKQQIFDRWIKGLAARSESAYVFDMIKDMGLWQEDALDSLLLTVASENQNPAVTEYFLKLGAEANMYSRMWDWKENTEAPLLALALVHNENVEVPLVLLRYGANPHAKDVLGKSILTLLKEETYPSERDGKRYKERRALLLELGVTE